MKTVEILDVPINVLDAKAAFEEVVKLLEKDGGLNIICTPNAEMIMTAQKDSLLMEVLQASTLNTADGIGTVWAGKFFGEKLPGRVPGVELCEKLLEHISKSGHTAYFLGAAPGVAQKAAAAVRRRYPGVKIVGVHDGFFDAKGEEKIIQQITQKKPDILIVGLGVPKQEKWMYSHRDLPVKVAIGCGGTINILSGEVKRAPKIFIKCNLEWLHRFITQPTRFWRLMKLPQFVITVLFRSIGNRSLRQRENKQGRTRIK